MVTSLSGSTSHRQLITFFPFALWTLLRDLAIMASSAFNEKSHLETSSLPPSVHGARQEAGNGDSASSVDHIADKTPPAPVLTKRRKVKNHCAKFWLWHVIGSIILLAIILPIV